MPLMKCLDSREYRFEELVIFVGPISDTTKKICKCYMHVVLEVHG